MKTIEVIKIGKYDPTQSGKYSRYEGYCVSTTERVDHPIVAASCEALGNRPQIDSDIYHSTLLRGQQTAVCLPKTDRSKVIPLAELKEVPFDLKSMVSSEEFDRDGSNLVRERFVQGFIDNSLLESREQIQARLTRVLTLIKNLEQPSLVLVSHSFLMKMLEAFVSGTDIFAQPPLLSEFITPNVKTYEYGEGFRFDLPAGDMFPSSVEIEKDSNSLKETAIKSLVFLVSSVTDLPREDMGTGVQPQELSLVPAAEIVKTVIGAVSGATSDIKMTMLLAEEIENPLPPGYHQLLNRKLNEGVKIHRLGFGSERDFEEVKQTLDISSDNFTFTQCINLNSYQRFILVDNTHLFFFINGSFFTTDNGALIKLIQRYFTQFRT